MKPSGHQNSWLLLGALLAFNHIVFSQGITPAMEKVYAMNEIVSDPDRQVGNVNPDSLPSLPVGINRNISGTQYIIAIDSAYFLPDGAYFNAYMAVEFPGADQRLAFAAKNIKFNPKGVIGGEQARLQLVSQHLIEMGPNTRLLLPSDGSNYVKWNCNGFESVNLHGYFLFDGEMLTPAENAIDSVVTAEFSVNVSDLHNMMTMVSFSPFMVKGMDDFTFEVSEAYVDMSDFVNPYQAVLPQCYHQTYADDINLWRGFYLKLFSVTLPEELNKNNDAITVYGENLFIDDAGVTGFFGAQNLFSTSEGELAGEWTFSVDLLEIGLTTNKLTSGKMDGKIKVPPLDNTDLIYHALISQNQATGLVDYAFAVNPADSVSMSCFNSKLTLFPTSAMSVTRANRRFQPKLILNGQWTLNNPGWKISGLDFEQFTLVAQSPYITQGLFSLISNPDSTQAEAGKFPVSLSEIGFGILNAKPVFGANIAFNLGEENDDNNFSAGTSVRIHTKFEPDPNTGKTKWKYDKFTMNTIYLAVNTQPFKLNGAINFNQDHPVYGTGFYGGLELIITSVMDAPMAMACAFGRVDGYRYWMVDATLPTNFPMGPTTTVTSITGGIAYHMQNTKTQQQLIGSVSSTATSGSALAPNYVPNQNNGLFFKAGVGFRNTLKEETLSGDVLFTISFNANGGLQNINLLGDAYMMCKRSERATSTNFAHGTVAINYDNQQKIFDAQLNVNAQFAGSLTADIWSKIYFSPGLWYIYLGQPSNPCTVNITGLASANAYFMFGQNLEPMPAPPPQVSSVLGGMANQRNTSDIAAGNGIACGMNLQTAFARTLDITDNIYIYASGSAGVGFDMTLYKYASTTHCAGSSEPFGMNYWYLQGQLYAYMGLDIGVTNNNWDVTLLQGNAAMLLQGKMPKPSYIYGGVYLQANILNLVDVDVTLDFDFGTNCEIIN
jgi:hypothetical protein